MVPICLRACFSVCRASHIVRDNNCRSIWKWAVLFIPEPRGSPGVYFRLLCALKGNRPRLLPEWIQIEEFWICKQSSRIFAPNPLCACHPRRTPGASYAGMFAIYISLLVPFSGLSGPILMPNKSQPIINYRPAIFTLLKRYCPLRVGFCSNLKDT